jgi:CBS domain-containing protein
LASGASQIISIVGPALENVVAWQLQIEDHRPATQIQGENMRKITTLQDVMTPVPRTVHPNKKLREAAFLMRSQKIRHLPVEEDGKCIGILSDRDLRTAATYLGSDADFLRVRNAMIGDPYCVSPGTSLAVVARHMAKKKYGCVVVTDTAGKIVGIFTAVDALEFIARALDAAESGVELEDTRRIASTSGAVET